MSKNEQSVFMKLPPQALDLEEGVLGALMENKEAYYLVSDILSPESFYKESHKEIYKAIKILCDNSSPVDILTVTEQIRSEGKLEIVGGMGFIMGLTARVSNAANIEFHARIVQQKYIQREFIKFSNESANLAYEDTTDIFDLIEINQSNVFGLTSSTYGRQIKPMTQLLSDALDELEQPPVNGLTGIGSGFVDLDKLTGGWQNSDLIILAARPGMGKTAFAMQLARNAAVIHGKSVAFFSLEMSDKQLTNRLIASETGIYLDKIIKRNLNDFEKRTINTSVLELRKSKIYVDDTPSLSISSLRSKAIRLKRTHKIDSIIIDYLQLMKGDYTNKSGNREQEISSISRGLKSVAKELGIPVIALAQLSRAVEIRGGNKKPMLSDLRESGAIEQDADMVMFLYRPEYYGIVQDESGNSIVGLCELITAKNRSGVCDTINLDFNGALMRFKDWKKETDFGRLSPSFYETDRVEEIPF